jgi:hypothetical protein
MKKPDEIKKGLNVCGTLDGDCDQCTYAKYKVHCTDRLRQDALALIQQLEAKDVKQSQRIAELEQELATVKRERDAAVDSLRGDCRHCKYITSPSCEEPCRSCIDGSSYRTNKIKWEWRGVHPDMEVQGDG